MNRRKMFKGICVCIQSFLHFAALLLSSSRTESISYVLSVCVYAILAGRSSSSLADLVLLGSLPDILPAGCLLWLAG